MNSHDQAAKELEDQAARIAPVEELDLSHEGGRPTVATPDKLAKAQEYVDGGWKEFGDAVPMVEGLADYLDISTSTVYARQEFTDIIQNIKRKQARLVASGGLKGTFNPMISKLILSSKHGYVERTAAETDNRNTNTNLDATDLSEEEIDAKLGAIEKATSSSKA